LASVLHIGDLCPGHPGNRMSHRGAGLSVVVPGPRSGH